MTTVFRVMVLIASFTFFILAIDLVMKKVDADCSAAGSQRAIAQALERIANSMEYRNQK
jgi:hypothetical protein